MTQHRSGIIMLEKKYIKEHLERTFCYKCGSSLEEAKLTSITDAPVALIAHAVCPKCQAESMVTITATGSGSIPMISDLHGDEIKKFLGVKGTSYDELLDLHKLLKKESVWNLLHKQDKILAKKLKKSNATNKSRL